MEEITWADIQNWPPMDFTKLDPRDYLGILRGETDVEAHIREIEATIHLLREERNKTFKEIEEARASKPHPGDPDNEAGQGQFEDALYRSIWQAASHSAAAIGILVPLTESMFRQSFLSLGKRFPDVVWTAHSRWNHRGEKMWDCDYTLRNGKWERLGKFKGITQLIEATGISSQLPPTLPTTLGFLFRYRNEILHHSFEWPVRVRREFMADMEKFDWPKSWLTMATTSDEPWVIGVSDEFVDHCLIFLNHLVDAFCKVVKENVQHYVEPEPT